jgi:hypothetical protein
VTDQQKHLFDAIEQQKTLISEMQVLERDLTQKREVVLKLQGIVEYLTQIGVTLPETAPEEEPSEIDPLKDVEVEITD